MTHRLNLERAVNEVREDLHDEDRPRVVQVRNAYANGTYHPPAIEVARKIFQVYRGVANLSR